MFYTLLKLLFKTALRVFFRQIHVRRQHLVPSDGPLIIASNHPNTFMDPIALASIVPQEVFFIAKSTVFSSPFKSWLLGKMNLVPIYRREDGAVAGGGNDATFRKCFEFLQRRGTLLIFPEGNSFNERKLRPLKTGTARLALEAEAQVDFKAGVLILPVGLNYSDPTQFQSDLFINVGEPIRVAGFADLYHHDPFAAGQQLTDLLKQRLENLLVITSTAEEDELVEQVEEIYKQDLIQDLGLGKGPAEKFNLTQAIADSIRYFNTTEPGRVLAIRDQIAAYRRHLQGLGVQDKFLRTGEIARPLFWEVLKTILYLVLGLPFYLFGFLTNYIPYILPGIIARRLTTEEEFLAPIMMTVGIFTFAGCYPLEIWVVYNWTGSLTLAYLFAAALPLTGFFAWQYYYRLRTTRGYLRIFAVFHRRKSLIDRVLQERRQIILGLEEARDIYRQRQAAGFSNAPINDGFN